ncbi:MAG: DNA mismatch endonuclease Vsr [Bacteroidetes bacterium]|nr:DNA mismatch endonuclease Vsr [Bacteroidota bacterium]
MSDTVSRKTRSRMMAGIRGQHTQPELLVRKLLHERGFRYRLHRKDLPGTPDIVLPKYTAVIQVHGCFWHGHNCRLFKLPGTRTQWWAEKLEGNRARDERNTSELVRRGWRVLVVWECALEHKGGLPMGDLAETLQQWLRSRIRTYEITGDQ